jgi:hypothetical protein
MLNLRPLHLHAAVEEHLRRYKTDAYAFLHTEELINRAADSSEEAVTVQYSYTKALNTQIGKGRLQWLFMMLMWYDVVKLARPDSTARRISKHMEEDVLKLVKNPCMGRARRRGGSQSVMWPVS